MADTLDSGKRRGFRSRPGRGSGPTGPGGPTRPGDGRPSRGPSSNTRPSSGASVGSVGNAPKPTNGDKLAAEQRARKLGQGGTNVDMVRPGDRKVLDDKYRDIEDQAKTKAAEEAARTPEQDADSARQAAQRNRDWANSSKNEALKQGNANEREGADALRSAGIKPQSTTSNSSGSKPSGFQGRLQALNENVRQNRSRWIAGGGIVGLLVALTFGFLGLLPLKLESIMKNILEQRIENRTDHYMETRADKLIQNYLTSSVGVGADGKDDTAYERAIVNYGEPIRDLYRNWRVSKFEDRLKANQGLEFKKTANGIEVFKDGSSLGEFTGGEARAALRVGVRAETKWYQVVLRMHLTRWMINAYKVSRFGGWFSKKTNSTADPAATTDEMVGNTTDSATSATADQTTQVMTCALSEGDTCETDPNNPKEAERTGPADTQASQTNDSADPDVENAVNQADQTAADKAKAYLHGIAQNVGNPNVKTDKLVGRILTKYFTEEVSKDILSIVSAAKGPLIIISLVDIASRLDHFLYTGTADKVLVAAHEVEYANQFATWVSMDDEWKDGKTISGDEFNSMQQPLDGVEQSQAFQNLYLHNTSGQPLTTTEDGNGGTVDSTSTRSIDEHSQPIADYYKAVFANQIAPGTGMPWHVFLNGWFVSGGKIWKIVNNLVGDFTSFLFKILGILFPPLKLVWSWLLGNLDGWIVKLVLWVTGTAVDGTERGADLMNGLDAGGAVTGIGFGRDLGAPRIGTAAAAQLDSTIARENNAAASQLSIRDRLFSTDYDHSLVNTLAAAVPGSPHEAASDSLNYVASLTQNPVKAFMPLLHLLGIGNAQAATANGADSLYGMYDWGYTDAQLGADDTAAISQAEANATQRLGHPAKLDEINLGDCPDVDDPTTQPNVCRLDIATMQSLSATSTSADDGGFNSPGGNP